MANTVNSPKPKLPVLVLPAPHRISGDINAMLESTISERFMTISLVPHTEKDVSKGKLVLSHTPSKEDPKVLASTWNNALGHLVRFIQPLIDAWASGIGLSGDGSALYVSKNSETVYKVVPAIKGYDLYMVPNGRAGAAKYRVSIPELIAQVMNRATSIQSSIDTFGVAVGKERTTKAEQAPEITVIL
jgi:hypothetical protein